MPIQDPNAKGMYFGLNLNHTRGHLVKAAFEGMGFGLDQNISMLRGYGADMGTATAVGGGTKTPLWIQTVSDITGVRQQVPEVTVGASYGDALMAGIAVGLIESPQKIKEMIKIKYVTEPNPDTAAVYDKYRPIFKELYQRNKDLMHQLP
jgi:xylulokinase